MFWEPPEPMSTAYSSPQSDHLCHSLPFGGEQAVQTCERARFPDFAEGGLAGPAAHLRRCWSRCSGHGFTAVLLKHSWNPALSGHRGHWVLGAILEGVSHTVTYKVNYSANGKRLHLTYFIHPNFWLPLPFPTLRDIKVSLKQL